ncbi:MAG: hypothetical protein HRT68_00600, partial [Flavobacteriaceae bacterium]|nr:hypothetical protein [Flavobacteriaceae bacterium]
MKFRVLFFVLLLIGTANLLGQGNVNNYKFVIVPSKFTFQTEPDQYRINTLIRYLFKQKGYDVYLDTETYPNELNLNNCKALKANMESRGLFDTKTIITLLDCKGNIVFASEEGVSKTKDYKKGYQESIRKAFESVDPYAYIAPDDESIYGGSSLNAPKEETMEDIQKNIDSKANNAQLDQFYAYNDAIYLIVPGKNDDSFDIIKKDFKATKEEDQNTKVGDLVPSSRENTYILKMD